MLRFFIKFYKLNVNDEQDNLVQFFSNLVYFYLIFHKLECIDYLLNESDLCYSYVVPRPNSAVSNTIVDRTISTENNNNNLNSNLIVINKKDISDKKPLHLNDIRSSIPNNNDILNDIILMRYKKIIFVYKYTPKPLNIQLSEILRY